MDNFLHGSTATGVPSPAPYSAGESIAGISVVAGCVFLLIMMRVLIRCSSKTLDSIILVSGSIAAFSLWVINQPGPAAVILSLTLIRVLYMREAAKAAEAATRSWNPKPEPDPDPEPKAAPAPEPRPRPRRTPNTILFDSADLTEKERKILALALDKAAQPGESEAAWVKFGKSLRTRGVGRFH
jgi:hypothetical protein